jgi:signal transduction histidine kinase/ligand-binding sensor domain-containing protein/AraC-like DNA-binding protein
MPSAPARAALGLIALLGAAPATAAAAQADATTSELFVHEAWSVQHGLPVNAVKRVLQGRDGYLWLATYGGLVRFDGVRFTVFDTGNTEELPSSRIVDLTQGADGSLWMRTEPGHLVRLQKGEFTHFDEADGLRDRSTKVVHVDAAGQLWVGSDHGVYRLSGKRFRRVAASAIDGEVTTLMHEAEGALWVGTRHAGLFRIQGDRVTRFDTASGLSSNWILALQQDREGALWVGTEVGAHRYRGGTFEHVLLESGRPLGQHVLDIRISPVTGAAWLATESGLYATRGGRLHPVIETPGQTSGPNVRFDAAGAAWYAVGDRLFRDGHLVFRVPLRDPAEQRPLSQILNLAWDHEGSLWIGTHSSGLYRVKPSLFRVYSTAEGVADRNVTVVLEDRAGALWMGTFGRGLSRLAEGTVTRYTPEAGFPVFVLALMQDRAGGLWVGTQQQGIAYCRLPEVRCGPPPGGQPTPTPTLFVRALHQDAAGDVWAGTEQGLFRLRAGAWERMDAGTESSTVRVFLEAADGTLWMGTDGEGVLAFRENRFSRFRMADGLPSDLIRSLYHDAHGHLWVGTEGRGLARITPRTGRTGEVTASAVRVIRRRDGLFDEVIHQILADDLGRLWMSTNRGIFSVSAAELDGFAEGRLARIHSTAYTERDGLRDREANGGSHPAGVRSHDGHLWFATQDGAAVVDPASTRLNRLPPPVVVERLVTRGRALRTAAGRVRLDASERDFEIDYTALSFLAPENVQFRYRLEGLTSQWTEAGNRRTAFYTNVPPGEYIFRVVASNNDGVWNEAGAALALRVTPRFHETRAAFALLVLTLGLAGAGGYQWRLRALRQRERELTLLVQSRTAELRRHEQQLEAQNAKLSELHQLRSRLFANLSHEFRTPLTLILGPLRSLLDGRHGTLSASVREQHELMLRSARRLLRLINQLLDLAKLQAHAVVLQRRPHELVAFARAVCESCAPLAERRGIALRFHTEAPALAVAFDAEQLEKALLNLLSNALKFTPAGGVVEVSVSGAASTAEITVRDTGVGIAPDELARVFDRFYQVDATATRQYEGTGIGLALAKELVELHGGEIVAISTPGAGSTFTVRLPLGEEAIADAHAAPAPPAPSGRDELLDTALAIDPPAPVAPLPQEEPTADRTTVLVIDDNADVRAYIRSILKPSYRVIEAADGQAGLEMVRGALPDLVVADVMMPELDGLALGRALKADAMTDAIPVVLLTARAAPEDHVAGLEAGADTYLVKPFDPAVLEATVAGQLAQRRRLRERFRQGEPVPEAPPPAAPSALELRLRPLVTAHIHDPDFGPDALAAAASLSYHQLYRALRDELGTTPSHFIRAVRAECAAELLRQRAGSVTEIAYSVGFESLSYFRRAFRERFGGSPTEYLADLPPSARQG